MPSNCELSIIVVSFNTKELTLQTLASIHTEVATNKELKHAVEIILVDNNSGDDSVVAIRKWSLKHPEVRLSIIANKKNVGFARANNQGIEKARGKFCLLLNSDTILQKNCLSNLLSAASEHPKTLIAAHLLNPDMTDQPQGGDTPSLRSLAAHLLFLDDVPIVGRAFSSTQHTGKNTHQHTNKNNLQYKGWVAATVLLANTHALRKLGGLSESFFMYGEDMELCLRAQQAGIRCAIAHNSRCIHLKSASSSTYSAIIGELQGYRIIWKLHKPSWQRPILELLLILGTLARVGIFATMGERKKKTEYWKALNTLLET